MNVSSCLPLHVSSFVSFDHSSAVPQCWCAQAENFLALNILAISLGHVMSARKQNTGRLWTMFLLHDLHEFNFKYSFAV